MLFNSLQIAAQSFNASSVGTQVAGQNLANANTPSYVREQVVYGANSTINYGSVALGSGVSVNGVVQMIDNYLEERLRNSLSDAMNSSTQSNYYFQLETVLSELSDSDISTALTNFFNSISEILNYPETVSYRQLAVSDGMQLADNINKISGQLTDIRISINESIKTVADEINRLTAEIAELNKSIAEIEAGRSPATQALGLRDQRLRALSDLSQLIDVKTNEDTATGMVTVSCGSDILVMDAISRQVYVDYDDDPYGLTSLATVKLAGTNHPLSASSGQLYGYYNSRDKIIGGYMEQLDEFAYKLIGEFNKLYSGGQGLTGYSELTSLVSVDSTNVPLDKLELAYPPKNGVLEILVYDTESETTRTEEIRVQLGELADKSGGMTLEDLVAAIDSIEGISAKIDAFNRLEIVSDSPDLVFSFGDDTSGILSALGINTFFTGTDARTIGVNATLQEDAGKFAASKGGIGYDTDNATVLANMPELTLNSLSGQSITGYYRTMNNSVNINAAKTNATAEGNASYYSSLNAQRAAVSGVNIDEESLNMMSFQRAYQATAKYVTVINEMLDSLIAM